MKIRILAMAIVTLCLTGALQAQDYKVAKSTGKLKLYIGRVTVEGYDGKEIIFSSRNNKRDNDERAKGLQAINSMGVEDNTGLGIHVSDKGDGIEVYQLKKMDAPDIRIMVPRGVTVSFSHESQYGGKAVFRNIENEIEISANYNSIELDNVTGPLIVKSVYGNVDATFAQQVKGPVSIVSIYGYADITMPHTTKADVRMSTSYGEMYISPEFKIDIEKTGDMIRYGDRINGKLNGGGIKIDFRSDYGKIYLRKK
jgi:hypothetical protein